MKLWIEGDIYFIQKFHILETGTVKLFIETGLSPSSHAGFASVCRDRIELPLSTVELNLVDCRVELHCDLH
jgi:hypothetical protein